MNNNPNQLPGAMSQVAPSAAEELPMTQQEAAAVQSTPYDPEAEAREGAARAAMLRADGPFHVGPLAAAANTRREHTGPQA